MRIRHATPLALALLVPMLLALLGPAAPSGAAKKSTLSNGCAVNARGVPSCGAYVGGAYGANSDVRTWERYLGKKIGVHRTYYGSGSVNSAVKMAKTDLANNRLPWISFKAPYSWKQMAAGKGDAWARSLATKMKSVGGPVWVAVHHEPEGDGDMQVWKKMQERLAPIMRKAAPNLGYSVILMGYHQFHGAKKYSLSATWPKTKVDVAGFDIYEKYGNKGFKTWKNWDKAYFSRLQQWSKSSGVPWALAETGYTHAAANKDAQWMNKVYGSMVKHGGIAFSYFNTNLHSASDWRLSTTAKKKAITAVNKKAPTLR